jgi:hypothetical protein
LTPDEDDTEGGSEPAHTYISRPRAVTASADAPALDLGGSVDRPAPPILGVTSGGCFTVTLANRSTQARYFLQTTAQVHSLLSELISVSAAAVTSRGAGVGAAESAQARLPNAMERAQLLRIQERLSKCLTPAFCLECANDPPCSGMATALLENARSGMPRLARLPARARRADPTRRMWASSRLGHGQTPRSYTIY